MLSRTLKHLFYPPWLVRRCFPPETLSRIEAAIQASEQRHSGEIRFAVESALDWNALWADEPCRERAIEAFSELRIWDTERNNGVLIYLLLADRCVEIVADRGLNQRVDASQWRSICEKMREAFQQGRFEQGVLLGIAEIEKLLIEHFPPRADDENELSNKPVIL